MNDIGKSPDYGRDDDLAVECPECGSTDVENDGINGWCNDCGTEWAIGPDPLDYPEYDR